MLGDEYPKLEENKVRARQYWHQFSALRIIKSYRVPSRLVQKANFDVNRKLGLVARDKRATLKHFLNSTAVESSGKDCNVGGKHEEGDNSSEWRESRHGDHRLGSFEPLDPVSWNRGQAHILEEDRRHGSLSSGICRESRNFTRHGTYHWQPQLGQAQDYGRSS